MDDGYEMSAEGLETLRAEVEALETTARQEIAEEIKTAREYGDLKENAEYHAAKEAQGMLERRIRQLREQLDHAVVAEASGGGTIGFGSVVDVCDEETGEQRTYTLVSALDAAAGDGKVSVDSPVARALRGGRVGDVVAVTTPRGERRLRIVAIR
jgi:transcription elongation factor GreA